MKPTIESMRRPLVKEDLKEANTTTPVDAKRKLHRIEIKTSGELTFEYSRSCHSQTVHKEIMDMIYKPKSASAETQYELFENHRLSFMSKSDKDIFMLLFYSDHRVFDQERMIIGHALNELNENDWVYITVVADGRSNDEHRFKIAVRKLGIYKASMWFANTNTGETHRLPLETELGVDYLKDNGQGILGSYDWDDGETSLQVYVPDPPKFGEFLKKNRGVLKNKIKRLTEVMVVDKIWFELGGETLDVTSKIKEMDTRIELDRPLPIIAHHPKVWESDIQFLRNVDDSLVTFATVFPNLKEMIVNPTFTIGGEVQNTDTFDWNLAIIKEGSSFRFDCYSPCGTNELSSVVVSMPAKNRKECYGYSRLELNKGYPMFCVTDSRIEFRALNYSPTENLAFLTEVLGNSSIIYDLFNRLASPEVKEYKAMLIKLTTNPNTPIEFSGINIIAELRQ